MSREWPADLPPWVPETAAHAGVSLAIAGSGLMLGGWVATQYAAYRLGFHPALGPALLTLTTPRPGLLPMSLYLTIWPADIPRTRPLLRLLLQQIIRRLTETRASGRDGVDGSQRPRLLMMLDEFLTLGRLDGLPAALPYLPASGIRAYLIVPSLIELAHVYGRDHERLVADCRARVAYAPDTVETAAFIADMSVGTTAPKDPHRLASPTVLDPTARGPAISRPLVTPHDLLHLPPDDALVFVPSCPPIYGKKIRFSLDPEFGTRAQIPPPTVSDRLSHDWSSWTARIAPPVPEIPALPSEPAATTSPPHPTPPPDDDPALPIPPDEAF